MPTRAEKWVKDRDKQTKKSLRDAKTLQTIQKEAKTHGATLASGGKGGLDPALALDVFRKGGWKCSNKKCPTPKKNLSLDHISGHPKEIKEDGAQNQPDLKKGVSLGHINVPAALHVMCEPCHSRVHDRENALNDGKKPPPVRGG